MLDVSSSVDGDSVSADGLHLLRLILDAPSMREMSVAEQRYQAVLAVISDGPSVTEVAAQFGVSRQTMHTWLGRYEAEGLEGLANRSHRPGSCPHQMPAVGAGERCWSCGGSVRSGGRGGSRSSWPNGVVSPVPSESAVYRALVRRGLIEPQSASIAGAQVEAVGAGLTDGVVADGSGRRVPAG